MTNIDRITRHIAKNGAENMLIHTLPNTNIWIVAEKIEVNKWVLSMGNPMGNVTYNLGEVTDQQHLNLWQELFRAEINAKISQIERAKQLKKVIYNFNKKYAQNYKKFTKVQDKKAKQKRTKLCKKPKRLQKPII